jgi:hypothetical protein
MSKIKEHTETHQKCSTCNEMKIHAEFYRDSSMKHGLSSYCKQCQKVYDKKYQLTDKYKVKVRKTKWRKQGIEVTYTQYEQMIAASNGACEICGKTENQFGKGMCVDHDHDTGTIRGILCTDCNMGVGNLKDDLDLLYKAVAYLERYTLIKEVC